MNHKNLFILWILIIILFYCIFIPNQEGFTTVPIKYTDNTNKTLITGYYKVDASNMAVVPYGFAVNSADPEKIVPISETAATSMKLPQNAPSIPVNGEKMPDDYYLRNRETLGVLPPNMKPNLETIEFMSDASNTPIIWNYHTGYISETLYYNKKFQPRIRPPILPPEVYYVDSAKTNISVLPFGMVADLSNGFGAKSNPSLQNNTVLTNYNKASNKMMAQSVDIQFHDSIEDLKAQNSIPDLSNGEIIVKDQSGNLVKLPKVPLKEWPTYYEPGSFLYGASIYVPTYEDSVYLSYVNP